MARISPPIEGTSQFLRGGSSVGPNTPYYSPLKTVTILKPVDIRSDFVETYLR